MSNFAPVLMLRDVKGEFAYPTLRKEREGWERIPLEEQMLLPAVTAWGTRRLVTGDRQSTGKVTVTNRQQPSAAKADAFLADHVRPKGRTLRKPGTSLLHFESVIRKFAFGDDLSIEEMDVSVGVTGKARVVRHHADGCAFTMQVFEQLHDGFAIF
jgi:hypothetical protein